MGGLVGRTCNYCHLKEFTGTWSTPETPSPTGPCDGSRRQSGVVASGRSSRVSGVAGCRTDEGTSLTQQKAMIEKFCGPIVGRGGRKGCQTGQVLPVRPIRALHCGAHRSSRSPPSRFRQRRPLTQGNLRAPAQFAFGERDIGLALFWIVLRQRLISQLRCSK